jgi:hypothetical protein
MKGGYVCTKCTIEYWPKQQPVKKQSKFDLPGPPTDSHGNVIGDNDIPIAVIDDVNKEVILHFIQTTEAKGCLSSVRESRIQVHKL